MNKNKIIILLSICTAIFLVNISSALAYTCSRTNNCSHDGYNCWGWECTDGQSGYQCENNDGSSNPPYEVTTPTPLPVVNRGVCGSADGKLFNSQPTANLCSAGVPAHLTAWGTSWSWLCEGLTDTVGCSTLSQVTPTVYNGECGATKNTCSVGTVSNPSSTAVYWTWNCDGQGWGSQSAACGIPQDLDVEVPSVACSPDGRSVNLSWVFRPNHRSYVMYISKENNPDSIVCPDGWRNMIPFTNWPTTCVKEVYGSSIDFNTLVPGDSYRVKSIAWYPFGDFDWLFGMNTVFSCPASSPVRGVCGTSSTLPSPSAPTTNLCFTGTSTPVTRNVVGTWDWSCLGPNNSLTSDDSVCSSPMIKDGSCGSSHGLATTSAPVNNLCEIGVATAVTGTGPWYWTCLGYNTGATAHCEASPPSTSGITATCSNTSNTATVSWDPHVPSYNWNGTMRWFSTRVDLLPLSACQSPLSSGYYSCGAEWSYYTPATAAGQITSMSLNIIQGSTYHVYLSGTDNTPREVHFSCPPIGPPPVGGSCGTAKGGTYPWNSPPPTNTLCASGTSTIPIASEFGFWTWGCNDPDGGATCSANIAKIDGLCGTSKDQCAAGYFIDGTDIATEFKWTCGGYGLSHSDSPVCSATIPPVSDLNCSGLTMNPSASPVNINVNTTWTLYRSVSTSTATAVWRIEDANGTSYATSTPNGTNVLNKTFTTVGLKNVYGHFDDGVNSPGLECHATTSVVQEGGNNRER